MSSGRASSKIMHFVRHGQAQHNLRAVREVAGVRTMSSGSASSKILHFVRHGQAQHNIRAEVKKAAGCSKQELLDQMKADDVFDAPLTEVGLQQTRDAARRVRYARSFTEVELVAASPLWRALQTADRVLPKAGVPRVCLEQLRERKGVLECCQRRSASQLKADWPNWDFGSLVQEEDEPLSSDLESVQDCTERAYDGIRAIWARPEANILLVAHGGVLRHLLNDHPQISADAGLKGGFENCEIRSCELVLKTEEEGGATGDCAAQRKPTFALNPLPEAVSNLMSSLNGADSLYDGL